MTVPLIPEELDARQRLCETARDDIAYMFGDSHYDRQTWTAIKPHLDYITDTVLPQLFAQVREAEARGWQPIETAPKDGTWIMVINANAHDPKPWFVRMKRGTWVNQKNMVVEPTFTHWQPLPPPPAREGSEG